MESKKHTRSGENQASVYRSGRFYTVSNEWYFSVREAEDQGPYSSKSDAEKQLKIYISDQQHFNDKKLFKLELI